MLIVIDAGVMRTTPGLLAEIMAYATHRKWDLVTEPVSVEGGESAKTSWERVEMLYQLIDRHGLCRHSYIFAIGGGAMLDLVGFAAATAHRGIRHLRLPTTTLSQGDGGVGVKNGINYFGKKNFVGSFAVPFAVVNDFKFLETLPDRQKRAGLVEAVKVALIKDRAFFEWMEANAAGLSRFEPELMEKVIRRSAELHVDHIARGGDPFELTSARPLDFGHWAGHKLEQLSGFRLSHGEAVAIGLALDIIYARRLRLLGESAAERVLRLLETLGFTLVAAELDRRGEDGRPAVLTGIEEFREHLGGELTITLISEIGHKLDVHAMDSEVVQESIGELLNQQTPSSKVCTP